MAAFYTKGPALLRERITSLGEDILAAALILGDV